MGEQNDTSGRALSTNVVVSALSPLSDSKIIIILTHAQWRINLARIPGDADVDPEGLMGPVEAKSGVWGGSPFPTGRRVWGEKDYGPLPRKIFFFT